MFSTSDQRRLRRGPGTARCSGGRSGCASPSASASVETGIASLDPLDAITPSRAAPVTTSAVETICWASAARVVGHRPERCRWVADSMLVSSFQLVSVSGDAERVGQAGDAAQFRDQWRNRVALAAVHTFSANADQKAPGIVRALIEGSPGRLASSRSTRQKRERRYGRNRCRGVTSSASWAVCVVGSSPEWSAGQRPRRPQRRAFRAQQQVGFN